MAKMTWEVWIKQAIAQAKEDFGMNNIWKYMRWYRMFMERYKYKAEKSDITQRLEKTIFWRGKAILWDSAMDGAVVLEYVEDSGVKDANGNLISATGEDANGVKHKVEFGKNAVMIYNDSTQIAPVLYIWAMANEILNLEDILHQQNNMLRKPIMVAGEGASFDDAMAKVQNVLSGVAWFNYNNRKGKTGTVLDEKMPVEVLNLQVGNSYKGIEVWDNIKNYEERICDFLGFTTTKNEKRERMNTLEIENENSIGVTLYLNQTNNRKDKIDEFNTFATSKVEFVPVLKVNEGGEKNDSKEEMDRDTDSE